MQTKLAEFVCKEYLKKKKKKKTDDIRYTYFLHSTNRNIKKTRVIFPFLAFQEFPFFREMYIFMN